LCGSYEQRKLGQGVYTPLPHIHVNRAWTKPLRYWIPYKSIHSAFCLQMAKNEKVCARPREVCAPWGHARWQEGWCAFMSLYGCGMQRGGCALCQKACKVSKRGELRLFMGVGPPFIVLTVFPLPIDFFILSYGFGIQGVLRSLFRSGKVRIRGAVSLCCTLQAASMWRLSFVFIFGCDEWKGFISYSTSMLGRCSWCLFEAIFVFTSRVAIPGWMPL